MRTEYNSNFNEANALNELDALVFAVSATVDLITKPGTNEREVGENVVKGMRARVGYLRYSFSKLLEQRSRGQC